MLGLGRKLFFPSLVHVEGPGVDIYRLDWTNQEKMVLPCNSTSLPLDYDVRVKNLLFWLPRGYVVEVRRCTRAALSEFNMLRQLGSSIKEQCLKPGVAYVETAFRLLADSIFDESKKWYTRDYALKTVAFHAMLYKFWCHQVKTDRLLDNACIYGLVHAITYPMHQMSDTSEVRSLVDAINGHIKNMEA